MVNQPVELGVETSKSSRWLTCPSKKIRAKFGPIDRPSRARHPSKFADALVFGDDVAQPAPVKVVQAAQVGKALRLLNVNVYGPTPIEDSDGVLEFATPLGVAGKLVYVTNARIDDHQRDPLRKWKQVIPQRRTVQEDRAALFPEHRGGLIHDPARHPDRAHLGALAGAGLFKRIKFEVGDAAQRQSSATSKRPRRKPGPAWEGRGDGAGKTNRGSAEQIKFGATAAT